jgi:hypothetical protein
VSVTQNTLSPTIQCPAPVLAPGAQGVARVAVDDANARLIVTFLTPITPSQEIYLTNPLSYTLTGGQRLFPRILSAALPPPSSPPGPNQSVVLTLNSLGDFSIYTLTVNGPDIDPFFGSAKLRFRLACDDPFDCSAPAAQPPPQPEMAVAIDYLTKDYAGFRQALLDFIPTRLPAWTEQNEADLGIVLVELFSAAADNLSYMQDRVANEAFLGTATQRQSVAGHLALIGYQMDDGASAHTWLQFQVNSPQPLLAGFKVSNNPSASDDPVIVFETLMDVQLDPASNQMSLYDWGNANCCLPQTEFSATLAGDFEQLKIGDYLIFDGGSNQRDVVRLTATPQIQTVSRSTSSPPVSQTVTVVSWGASTPLTRDYCVSGTTVRGNVVPATHGETVLETLRSLSDQDKAVVIAEIAARPVGARVPRQRLRLRQAPLAHLDTETLALGQPIGAATQTSSDVFTSRLPRSISTLQLTVDGIPWQEKTSLLESGANDTVFRVEMDDLGEATVVFGDGVFGLQPSETSTVITTYRVGGGSTGNVGADSLVLVRPTGPAAWLNSVTNPLPATGGRDWESHDHARRVAPSGFHEPVVAVSAADYQAAAASFVDSSGNAVIQRANASFLWTGSWLTVTLTVDPLGTEGLTADLQQQLAEYLNTRRLAGYDIQISGPVYVPVDLVLQVSVTAGSQQSDVEEKLLQTFSSGTLLDGSDGFFHPDNFTFGDKLFVSKIYAAAMSVPGVQSVTITRLTRSHSAQPAQETTLNLAQGYLSVGADEVIRLDNDRNFPENGTLAVTSSGAQA